MATQLESALVSFFTPPIELDGETLPYFHIPELLVGLPAYLHPLK